MKILGFISRAQLGEIARRGRSPEQAHDELVTEAKRRHPGLAVIVQRSRAGDGFDIIGL